MKFSCLKPPDHLFSIGLFVESRNVSTQGGFFNLFQGRSPGRLGPPLSIEQNLERRTDGGRGQVKKAHQTMGHQMERTGFFAKIHILVMRVRRTGIYQRHLGLVALEVNLLQVDCVERLQ